MIAKGSPEVLRVDLLLRFLQDYVLLLSALTGEVSSWVSDVIFFWHVNDIAKPEIQPRKGKFCLDERVQPIAVNVKKLLHHTENLPVLDESM